MITGSPAFEDFGPSRLKIVILTSTARITLDPCGEGEEVRMLCPPTPPGTNLVLVHLLDNSVHQFARVLEGAENFLRVVQPVGVDSKQSVKVVHGSEVFCHFSLK